MLGGVVHGAEVTGCVSCHGERDMIFVHQLSEAGKQSAVWARVCKPSLLGIEPRPVALLVKRGFTTGVLPPLHASIRLRAWHGYL